MKNTFSPSSNVPFHYARKHVRDKGVFENFMRNIPQGQLYHIIALAYAIYDIRSVLSPFLS